MPLKQQTPMQDLPYAKNIVSGGVPRNSGSGLTFSRQWLKHLANETIEIAKQGYYTNSKGERVEVQEALERAIQGSRHYHSSHVFQAPTEPGPFENDEEQTILICYASSLQAASELVQHHPDGHVGVLSSASAKNPSKFFRGTVSQEEVICRSSLLYPCLSQYEFLEHHIYVINNREKYRETSSACCVLSPRVPVIRNDSAQGELLDDCYCCTFASVPAPNAFVLGRRQGSEHERTVPKAQVPGSCEPVEHITLQQSMWDRIFRTLSMLAAAGCTELVLGAFGCGVHGNHPATVARIFRECLRQFPGFFRTIVFAIQPSRTGNYKAFQTVFSEATML